MGLRIKTDGYRAQVDIRDKRVTIYARSGYDWTEEFAPIAKAASKLKAQSFEPCAHSKERARMCSSRKPERR